ncbi:MAG: hypothetical protein JXR37_03635 [Kiritimatiellae bacterium]|nr:hypothetical protein [Kiritimatiellia bacterium]
MTTGYFQRVHAATPTRLWVNNPNGADLDAAVAAGAVGCTTNPAYCAKLLARDPEYIGPILDTAVCETGDDEDAAGRIYRRATARVIQAFRPLYDRTGGAHGYVTMQDFPHRDEDTHAVLEAALANRALGANVMAKIPVIQGGMQAIEQCVAADIPVCATEVFSLAQAVRICELYAAAARATGKHPPFYVTHISGIFDEYLARTAAREGIEVAPEILAQAGCAVARKQHQLLKARGYHATLMGGGARHRRHFTELVGGELHITINWRMAEELLQADEPVVSRIDAQPPAAVIEELCDKFVDFRRAYHTDGLPDEAFAGYGPVQLFRDAFVAGYDTLMAEIVTRRQALCCV